MKTLKRRPLSAISIIAIAMVWLPGLWLHSAQPGVGAAATLTYTNPVINREFPDPSILLDRGVYYAYSTNSRDGNVPCESSTDLVHWTPLPDAMPVMPPWARPGLTWAPNVRTIVPGKRYVVYFTARSAITNEQTVGVATGDSPAGPFTSTAIAPLIDQHGMGGSIDPSGFIDEDGTRYLVWKNDGNCCGFETWIWIQKLSPDGLSLVGEPSQLIKHDPGWEGNLVEGPTLWKHGGKYYLFYSANGYGGCDYAMGYAVSSTLLGPYVKWKPRPWVSSLDRVCGPGGEDIFTAADGSTWMAYHSWENGTAYRSMSIDPLYWDAQGPILEGPSRWPQAAPQTHTGKQ